MKKKIYQIVSISLLLIILGVAVYLGPRLWNDLQTLQWNWAIAGLGVYFINYLLRAERLRIISGKRLEIWPDAIHSASLHGVATYFLPVRTGDLTLPVILKSVANIGLAEGGQILLKARFLDITTLGLWMLGASLFTTVSISPFVRAVWFLLALGTSMLPLAIKCLKSLEWLARLRKFWVINVFETVTSVSFREIFISLGIWVAVASCFYCTARAVSLNIGIGDVWFLITIQLPLQLIPVQGLANTGNHEAGWVAGLALLGISASEGISFALASHALLIVYVLALGLLALISRKRSMG